MIEHLVAFIRELISPSMRFRLRESAAWIREQLDRARIWHWEIANLSQRIDNSPYNIIYLGRKTRRSLAKALLIIEDNVRPVKLSNASQTAIISEALIPGALRIPGYLRVTIPLGRTIETITAGFDDNFYEYFVKILRPITLNRRWTISRYLRQLKGFYSLRNSKAR